MRSVVEELLEKIAAESRGGARGTTGNLARGVRSLARADLGMVLFGEREAIDALWKAADAAVRAARAPEPGEGPKAGNAARTGAAAGPGGPEAEALAAAVERLRPLFGPRG